MDHLLELGSGMARFAELAGKATGDEPVPACPDWTTRDLIQHLGTVHRWAGATVLSGQRVSFPTPIYGELLVEWYAGTAAALLAVLQAVDLDEPVPNFSLIDERAAFFHRRQMHEVAVHVVDAAQALGLAETDWHVAPELAADGVEEVIRVFFPRMTARGNRPDVRSRIRLTATDTGQSWLIGPPEGEGLPPVLLHSTFDADTTVEGTATDLYLALWHRVSADRLTFGNADGRAVFDGFTTP